MVLGCAWKNGKPAAECSISAAFQSVAAGACSQWLACWVACLLSVAWEEIRAECGKVFVTCVIGRWQQLWCRSISRWWNNCGADHTNKCGADHTCHSERALLFKHEDFPWQQWQFDRDNQCELTSSECIQWSPVQPSCHLREDSPCKQLQGGVKLSLPVTGSQLDNPTLPLCNSGSSSWHVRRSDNKIIIAT